MGCPKVCTLFLDQSVVLTNWPPLRASRFWHFLSDQALHLARCALIWVKHHVRFFWNRTWCLTHIRAQLAVDLGTYPFWPIAFHTPLFMIALRYIFGLGHSRSVALRAVHVLFWDTLCCSVLLLAISSSHQYWIVFCVGIWEAAEGGESYGKR